MYATAGAPTSTPVRNHQPVTRPASGPNALRA